MKKCKYCQSEIDEKAKICPNCHKKQSHLARWIVLGVIAVIIIAAIAGGGSSENGNASKGDANTETKERFTYNVTNEYNDSFAHYIEGTVINNRDYDYSYVQIEFICYDKEGNNIGTALDNTNNLLGNQTWKYKAMLLATDVKADHCDFHEVTGW